MIEKQPLTMKDIAAQLGVSVATVSRALKNSPNISKKRREMIQQYAREHDYYPNVIAEQLRHSRQRPSQIIGVILPEIVHFYFASILSGIEEKAKERGYRIMVAQSSESYEREVEICESFKKNKVCGIIVSQAKDTEQYDHFTKLVSSGIPLVFYDRICPAINASRVVVDDYQAAYKAVSYLIETGCKRVAFYVSNLNMEISKNRLNGYKDALYHHGLQPDDKLIVQCDNPADAEKITPSLLKMKDRLKVFNQEHPRVRQFFHKIKEEGLPEGSVLEMKVTLPDGSEQVTNIRVTRQDVETIQMIVKQVGSN